VTHSNVAEARPRAPLTREQPSRLPVFLFFLSLVVGGTGWLVAACDQPNVHLFSGQPFEAQGQCLEAPTALDVIGGAGATLTCPPACLIQSAQVYVSTQCPPYPPEFAVETASNLADASDPCAAALSAYEAGVMCNGDGGEGDAAVVDASASDADGG
jgi:hypothetical protein